MALEFLDISGNRRLAMFTKVLALMAQTSEDPEEVYRSLLTLMRQAFDQRCYVEVSARGLKSGAYRITRIWREDGSEAVANNSPWRGEGVPVRRGGVLAELLARAEPGAVNRLEFIKDDPAYPELGNYRSVALAPGGMGEWHNWVFVFDKDPDAFTPEDVEVLVLRVNLIGLSLKNLRTLAELRLAQRDIEGEVDRIAAIQKALLPADNPDVPGLQVAARSETFDRAGGDTYDYAALPDGQWGFMIADASGHGPSAAVVISMLNAILHTLAADRPVTPAGIMQFANVQLNNRRIEESFVTALAAMWNPKEQTLTYARAGHHPALLRRGSEVTQLKAVGNLPLGIFDDFRYEEHCQQLRSGDLLLMYTDGVVEAMNEAQEMFGEERLIETLKKIKGSAQSVMEAVWDAFSSHQAGGTPKDDQTLMVLKVL